jgi:hypothetical protein
MNDIVTRPILLAGPMVRAILEGRKTQTRRIMKPQPFVDGDRVTWWPTNAKPDDTGLMRPMTMWRLGMPIEQSGAANIGQLCSHGKPGDRLWVREAIKQKPNGEYSNSPYSARADWVYSADNELLKPDWLKMVGWSFHRSKPSIHMPRWASRITLEITGVRVERLNDINERDAIAEGVVGDGYLTPGEMFSVLWESINGKGSWAENPWVWCISFKVVKDRKSCSKELSQASQR